MVALAGTCVLAAGAYLQFGEDHAGASAPTSPSPRSSSAAVTARGESRKVPQPLRSAPSTTRGTKPPAAPVRPARPTGIAIPQLGVDAPVLAIKAVNAALTPPSDPTTVGWWSGGAQPGAKRGSAVITGHTVHSGGGAFDNLDKLVPGSVIQVSTVRGVLRYQVATVTTYRKATLAKRAAQVFDQSVAGRLVLVTCEDWNGEIYLSNVVVIALRMA
ncbi:class F sortase [Kribbella sp. NPDC026611]|uniref:class F sortase n=1 Tax=Kribbella sp. NPDC026611 TaxID=3154911 RepID=UPI00340D81CE